MALLEIRNLSKYFGGVTALHDVSFDVFSSEIVGIIGPNGAGKTTLFNVITGILPPTSGVVRFGNEDITGLRGDQIVRRGIGRTFQTSTLFMEATVLENVFTAFHMNFEQPLWKAILHTRAARKEERVLFKRERLRSRCAEGKGGSSGPQGVCLRGNCRLGHERAGKGAGQHSHRY